MTASNASPCHTERFPTLTLARAALLARRTRAELAGSPATFQREAYVCATCRGAHITRAPAPDDAA